eukprot:5382412-Pleurochrysis_carterae.AAC.1
MLHSSASFCRAAVKLTAIVDEAADANGKTKMFHIIKYIIPRQVARCAITCAKCLSHITAWELVEVFDGKVGGSRKHVVRRQTCARPRALKGEAAQVAAAGRDQARATIRKR